MNKKLLLLGTCLLMGAGTVSAQKRVTGRVVDASGHPVIHARVQVEGSKIVTVTDDNGNFTFPSLPASAKKLRVTYLGMKPQTVSVAGNVQVTLEDDNMLEEAVVVGYGTVKKGDFTGSVSAVKGKDLEKLQVSNVSKALEGMMPGVQITASTGQPGSAAAIYVRGIGSISANSAPLIIVDGAPYEGSLNTLNQADIESINLQKDASATSIYGARGSNGILYITTKKGRPGKSRVSVDAKWGWNSRAVSPYETVTGEREYYELIWEALYNRQKNSLGMSDLDARIFASQNLVKELGNYNSYNVADYQLINPMTGLLDPAASLLYHEDWNDETFTNGLRQEYNVSLSGGNDRTSYYMSFNYLDDKSYVRNSNFERMTGRLKLDHKAFEWLTLGANVSYSHTKTNGLSSRSGLASNLFAFTQYIAPIYPVYRHDRSGALVLDENGGLQFDLGNQDGRTRQYSLGQNPMIEIYNNTNETMRDVLGIRAYADIALPLKGLKFRADAAMDNFASYTDVFNAPITSDAAAVNGYGTKTSGRTNVINLTQRLNYDRIFAERHSISLMAAHETKAENVSGLAAHRSQFFLPENDFGYSLTNRTDPSSQDDSYHLESWLGRAEYSLDHKYSVSGTYRRDGSSMFAPECRWGNFWSVGAAWNLGEEYWFKAALGEVVNSAKLKVSYGTQGNDGILDSDGYRIYAPYLDHYSVMNSGTAENPEFSVIRTYRGNRDITWEKSKTFNVGVEASLLDRRLSLELDYFVKNTDDMLGRHTLPPSAGDPSWILTNEQAMRNKGVEVLINGVIMQAKDYKWTATLNMTHYKNELTRMQEGRPAEGYQSGNYWRKKGGSLYDWYMYKYAGVDPQTGDGLYYADVTETDAAGNEVTRTVTVNDINKATLYEIGKSALPKVYGGLTTMFEGFGFDLTVSTAFSLGGYTYDGSYSALMSCSLGSTFSTDIYKRWQKPGDVTDVPRLEEGYRMTGDSANDRFLIRSDYFSLRNVTLGYTFPQSWTARFKGISSVRVYGVGDNLFLGSKRKGLDPRQSISGAVDTNSYSALRTISFGINVNF